ncbi:MAG: short-chain dehydrogenase [Bacteroidetes bacterium]|nr:MAG: short-chain dehydrogenase [Bacteroidota bacterium]
MKTTLITGASSGIGKELAHVYAENNYNLVLVARRKNNLEDIKRDITKKHKVSVKIFDLDLSNIESAEQLYKEVSSKNIKVDVLINNAGYGVSGPFTDTDMEKETGMLVLNMVTLTKLSKLFANYFIKNGGGHIINIASTAAFQPVPTMATYAATKAYVLSFSEAIAYELKSQNVKVTAICPGATQSEFAQSADMGDTAMFNKAPTSRELAEFTYEAMIKGKTTAIHGTKNNFLTFTIRLSPRKLVTAIAAKMVGQN